MGLEEGKGTEVNKAFFLFVLNWQVCLAIARKQSVVEEKCD